jgi:enoyl-CoA hydratase/carnithine racemase
VFELNRDGVVHVLTMNNGQNLMDANFFKEFDAILDEVEAASAADGALVLTGVGKYFSNGLNLPVVSKLSREEFAGFGATLMRCMGRLLVLPLPTVAAVNGHAFAGGAILAGTCDYRTMREDRGWICVSEVDAGVRIDPLLVEILKAKLPTQTVRTSVLEGYRYSGIESLEAGWADRLASEDELLPLAMEKASSLASKKRAIFGQVKRALYGDLAKRLGHVRKR